MMGTQGISVGQRDALWCGGKNGKKDFAKGGWIELVTDLLASSCFVALVGARKAMGRRLPARAQGHSHPWREPRSFPWCSSALPASPAPE